MLQRTEGQVWFCRHEPVPSQTLCRPNALHVSQDNLCKQLLRNEVGQKISESWPHLRSRMVIISVILITACTATVHFQFSYNLLSFAGHFYVDSLTFLMLTLERHISLVLFFFNLRGLINRPAWRSTTVFGQTMASLNQVFGYEINKSVTHVWPFQTFYRMKIYKNLQGTMYSCMRPFVGFRVRNELIDSSQVTIIRSYWYGTHGIKTGFK